MGVLLLRAQLFGGYIRAPVFWKPPYGVANEEPSFFVFGMHCGFMF